MSDNFVKETISIFKEIYNDDFWERFENKEKYGKNWTDIEVLFGGPNIVEKLKETKLGKLVI